MSNKPRLVEYDRPAYITGLAHRVRQPQKAGPHPTVVMVHGRHGTEDVTWVFARALPANWLLVSPRAPEWEPETDASDDVGYSWLLQDDEIPAVSGNWPRLGDFDDGVLALEHFIQALPDVYGADIDQIYLLGFSQGAATCLALAMRHPGLVQGIASLVGFAPQGANELVEQQVLAGLPVFMAVGKKDGRIPLEIAQASAKTVRQAGAILTYGEYETGHKLNGAGMRALGEWWRQVGVDREGR